MQFKKLDGRHTLYKRGYRYAYVFRDYNTRTMSEYRIAEIVRAAEGLNWFDHTCYGKPASPHRRAYYIGFNNESTHTLVLLQM